MAENLRDEFTDAILPMKYLFAYRNIALPANAITIVMSYQIFMSGSGSTVTLLIWVKLVTTLALVAYMHLLKSNIVFFFMNLGVGKFQFYSSMYIIDVVIFGLITTVILMVK